MAKGNSTNTSSTNTSFSPSMNFGAPTPGEVANNAGLGPFGTVNWSGGPSSTTPTKDNAAEVEANKPTTPTVDTSNFAPVEGKGAVVSEEVFANNPVENAAVESDFSWVTDGKYKNNPWTDEYEVTNWDNKAEQAREVVGYNQRKARNWTYAGDWRATDKPVYTMINGTVIPNYKNERKYDKFIAPLEMNKAWKEANENIVAKNNIVPKNDIESISNALKAAGKDAGKINQELAKKNPKVAEEFDISGKVGKNFKDVEQNLHKAFRDYEAAKALKDADKEKEAKEALDRAKKDMREQIALENKVANETMNEFIEMVNKPDVPGLGKGVAKSAIEYNNTKIGDMTVLVTKSDADETSVNVTFVSPDGREVDVGQVGTEGYAGSFSFESLASKRDAFKNQTDLIGKAMEKSIAETSEETPEETPEESTISPEVTPETKEVTLNDVEEDINNIDVSKIENIKQAEEVNAKIEQTFTKLEVTARNQLENLVTDLMNEGKSLQAIKESPAFKSLATQIFRVAQNIYDKVNDVDEYTNRYFGDIDISSKRSIKKNADKISMRIDQMENKISPYMSKEDINALAKYSKSVNVTKDAAIALMKAAAFNGAENVKGDFWSDAYKAEKAEVKGGFKEGGKDLAAAFFGGKDSGKLTWGDWAAASIKGTAGVTATILGFAMMGVNPVAGTMLALSGIKTAAESGMKMALDVTRSKSTNEEAMFGSGENYVGKTIMNNIYNRSFEEANIGDPKSVATYTTVADMLRSLVEISTGNNLNIISAINTLKDGISNLAHGGMKGRTDALVNNVFALGKNIVEWADMNPNIINGISSEKGKNNNSNNNYNNPSTSYNFITDDIIEENKKNPTKVVENMGSTSFGVESGSAEAAASTYSGAKEQAKNSNLATDYNAGMEQDVNEAVSSKYVKVFRVMIDKEPDYIRKVLIAIPKNHCESVW